MTRADQRRRARRIALLLSAILIPTAAVILLVVRVVRQENELSDRRASEQRREALDQLRRELTAKLHALRLEQVNRLISESSRRLPPDSPIVFVSPALQDRLVLPWETAPPPPPPSAAFARWQAEGEAREFKHDDVTGAIPSYRQALSVAASPLERCSARVWLGRSHRKADNASEAERLDRETLEQCGDVLDADGVPLALYAAQRLLADNGAHDHAAEYVLRRAGRPEWRTPSEAFLLQSLLQKLSGPAADAALARLATEIRNDQQISSLARDAGERLARLQRASRTAPGDLSWFGYGDEPWLLTLVSPTPFATPVVMAVSSRKVLPAGVNIRLSPSPESMPLGDGFIQLYAEWPPGHFAPARAVSGMLYTSVLCFVLGAAMFAGYLLLRDVHREAETAQMRSHFVASVSHELKTPLTSIRAHAETLLLGRTAGPAATNDYLKTIVSESERLTRLVDSVLDFSRIEQGRKEYHLQPTRLHDVVASAAKTMEYPLSQLGFTLAITTDGTDPVLRADPEALTQALLNLLGNAMKYSGDARHIEMRLGTRDGEAFVDVVDHGIGISRDEQSRIFERFHRVQSTETAGIAGTGLGLPLALHVVEAHHGRIDVASQPGHGSTFSVLIPLETAA